eukprot:2554186-Rhodomonas_salina.1
MEAGGDITQIEHILLINPRTPTPGPQPDQIALKSNLLCCLGTGFPSRDKITGGTAMRSFNYQPPSTFANADIE